jgi:hypothetical protein
MVVSVMVEIAVVVIDKNAKISINCVRKGKLRTRAATFMGTRPARHPASTAGNRRPASSRS